MRLYEFKTAAEHFETRKWNKLDSDDGGVRNAIANAIGATHLANWGMIGVPWNTRQMIGGGGTYMLKTPNGHVMTDAGLGYDRSKIVLAQISIENKGNNMGTMIMEALRDYALDNNLGFEVTLATNREFFNRFDWLDHDGNGNYRMKTE